jgi:GTPase KRas
MRQAEVEKKKCELYIQDTCPCYPAYLNNNNFYTNTDGFIIMYSITDRETFKQVENYYEYITKYQENCIIKYICLLNIVLVGNKSDLQDERKVSINEGEDLARKLGFGFLEVSTKERINVEEAVFTLVRLIYKDYDEDEEKNDDSKSDDSKNDESKGKNKKCILF